MKKGAPAATSNEKKGLCLFTLKSRYPHTLSFWREIAIEFLEDS
jgi:hypothetical protein